MVLGVAYGSIFGLISSRLKRLGEAGISANEERFSALSEAFSAVKEVKVSGLEQAYIKRFAAPAEVYAKGRATTQIVGQLPRYLIEAVAFGGLLLVILYLMNQGNSFISALPVMALYVFVGYRLMPSFQQIYQECHPY
jgi:ABC-type bacteriocin/lantibiotic exporter with double-glycine peptidase domain